MADGPRIKVLLIEDDPDSRELLAEILAADFDVGTAADATSGLSAFTQQHPDVVVTDEALPGMAGTALAKEVKGLVPGAGVILVSGYHRPPHTEFCDVVLRKPVDVRELSDAVFQVYSRHKH
jgi:DNA-binding NtrC family response regulator